MNKTRWITLNALGIALFVVLTLCLQVPVFENYYLCLGYIVMMVWCYHFGAVSGTVTGTFGVILYCRLISGLRGMPGWALGNVLIGIILGLSCRFLKKIRNPYLEFLAVSGIIIITTAAAILGVKSLTESLLYSQPFLLRVAKNSYACVADIIVLVAGWPAAKMLAAAVRKTDLTKGSAL